MWKVLQESPTYSLIFLKKCKYYLFVTDYIKIWEVCYNDEEFIACLKKSNFGLEISTKELIEKGTYMLLHPKELKSLIISYNESLLTVKMTKLYSYPLHLKIVLNQGSNELFFQKVTQQLLKTVKDLRSSEQELRKILKQKDDEIEEYITIGGKIRYTALPPYNDEVHMIKHSEYEKHFGKIEMSNYLLEKTIEVPGENDMDVDIDNKRLVKQEPVSQEINTSIQVTGTLNQIKQESIKTEVKPIIPTRSKREKTLNI